MARESASTNVQQQHVPAGESYRENFLALLNNRGKSEPTRNLPARRNGFVVLARGAKSLKSIQALCFAPEQSWNTCLTARYRLQPGVVIGTLLAAFIVDLQQIRRGKLDGLPGVMVPERSDSAWQNILTGPLSSLLAEWPEEQKGALPRDGLDKL